MSELWQYLGGPVQIAYAVDNVVAAAESWVARGVGPFFVREHIAVTNSRMHGTAAAFDHSSAYAQWGNTMVELLCEHHPAGDRIGPASGVHHMAFFVEHVAVAQDLLISRGFAEVLYAEAGTTAFAMHDAYTELGHLIEIYQRAPGLERFYDMVRNASVDWAGNDPIRML